MWKETLEAWYEIRFVFYGCAIAIIVIILCGIYGHKKKKLWMAEIERRKSLPYDPNDWGLDCSIEDAIDDVYYDWFEYEGEKYGSGTIIRLFPDLRIQQGLKEKMQAFHCEDERAVKFITRTQKNMYRLKVVRKDENGNWVECHYRHENPKCIYFTYLVPEHFIQEIILPKELTRYQKTTNKNGRLEDVFRQQHLVPPVFTPLFIGGAICLVAALFKMFVPVASVVVAVLFLYFISVFMPR